MEDENKAKDYLLKELEEMRQRVAELEVSETERKCAEEALKLSSKRWSSTFNAITDSVCLTDMEGRILLCNEAMTKLLGKPHDEIVGRYCWELVHGTSAPIEGCPIVRMRKTRKRETMELSLGDRLYDVTVDSVSDDAGNLIGAVHIVSDITERKRAEENEKQNIQDLKYLSETAMGFVKLQPDADIYQHIAEHLKKLVGNSIVIVNSFDPKTDLVTVRAIVGLGKLSKFALEILGGGPVGTTYKINEVARRQLLTGNYHKVPGKMHVLSFGQMPKPICHALEKLFGITEIHSMGFTWEGELLGNVVIILREGADLKNKNVIETFINQAAVALQRRLVEEAFRESEDKYKRMFESVNDMVIYVTKYGKILDVNQRVEGIFGYTPDEVVGKNFMKLGAISLKDLPRTIKLFKHAAKIGRIEDTTGKGVNLNEFEIKRKDGNKAFIESSTTALKKDKKLDGFLSIIRDITERKKAEEALRQSEEKLRLMFEGTYDMISLTDANAKTIWANPAWREIFGHESEYEEDPFTCIHPADVENIGKSWQGLISGKAVLKNIEYRYKVPSGDYLTFESSAYPVEIDKEKFYYVIARDITERKKAEEALRHSEEKLRRTVESSPDAITVTDLNGNIIECNTATLGIHGFSSKEEIIGKNAFELISKQDQEKAMKNLKRTLELGSVKNVEYTLVTKDGREFPGELSASVIRDISGTPTFFVAITKDITERKKAEEDLLQSKKLASIGQLAAGVAHELNTPLANISLITANMSKMTNDSEILKKINTLSIQGKAATNIVQSLLDFSRKIEPNLRVVELNKVISESISQAVIRKPKTIEIIKDFGTDIPKIKADRTQLKQVFTNIIDNAFDAMLKGGKLTITTEQTDENNVEVRFMDTGVGLSKEDQKNIFDPFFSKKEVGKGVGLGLSICHGIVNAHNGSIEVESEERKGTTFIVKLPVG